MPTPKNLDVTRGWVHFKPSIFYWNDDSTCSMTAPLSSSGTSSDDESQDDAAVDSQVTHLLDPEMGSQSLSVGEGTTENSPDTAVTDSTEGASAAAEVLLGLDSRAPEVRSKKASSSRRKSLLDDDAPFFPIFPINGGSIETTAVCQVVAPKLGPKSCRTRLLVKGICCMSEVPIVDSILRPLPGVTRVGINVAMKHVFIDHDPGAEGTSARSLADALNERKLRAEILTDGGLELMKQQNSDFNQTLSLPKSSFAESTLFLPGAIDKEDASPIERQLRKFFAQDTLRAVHFHIQSQTLKVEHTPDRLTASEIMDALATDASNDWGDISVLHDGSAEGLFLPEVTDENPDDNDAFDGNTFCQGIRNHFGCVSVFVSGCAWVISLLSFVESLEWLKYAGIISVCTGMPPSTIKAIAAIRQFQFDSNVMMVTAAFGALALGEYDEAASVAFIFAISDVLESRATRSGREALEEIISLRPDYAHVIDPKSGGVVVIPAANIPVGTRVLVRTGDKAPADGVVIEGSSSVDESSITGESLPVKKQAGGEISSGTVNTGLQPLLVETTKSVQDSTVSRLIQLVEEAQANTSDTEMLIDGFARKYTPIVLSVAFLIATVPWCFGTESGRYWVKVALIFLVIACPCALTISTPVTYSAGLAATTQRGIVIKGGQTLESLGHVKMVLADKTGTLTSGKFSLSDLKVVDDTKSRKQVLGLLSIMEGPSSHPLSSAIVAAAREEGADTPTDSSLTDHKVLEGEGISARVNGKQVWVGNERLFTRLGILDLPSKHAKAYRKWDESGGTVGFVGVEDQGIIAMYCVRDTVRDEARTLLSSLRGRGVELVMLTGDSEGAAQFVGREIGLAEDCVRSQLLPQDKLNYATSVMSSRGSSSLVLFIGDGVNDAPALAAVDVGVAMGEGAALAMEISDVCLMDSNLDKLLFSMDMGAKVLRTVKENVVFSVVVNVAAITLTFMGKMTLLLAIVSDVGVMLLVTLNGMKLLSKRTIEQIEAKRTRAAPSRTHSGRQYELQSETASVMDIV